MAKVLFELRKLLPMLLMPFGLSVILIGFGLIRRRRAATVAGLLLLLIASMPAVSDSLCFYLENQYRHVQAAQCPAADVIVPLSGFAGETARFPGEIQWYDGVDRFESAVQLFRLQKAPIILFTDAHSPNEGYCPLGDLLKQAAIEHGVPANAIRRTRPAATTADEAAAVKDYLGKNGGRRVILVTSAFHMRRAAFLFRQAGIDFVPYPVDYESEGWKWSWGKFVPSPGSMALTEQGLHEIYGDVMYRVMALARPRTSSAAN